MESFMRYPIDELIDTLWNVNVLLSHQKQTGIHRINRYIMECKFKTATICLFVFIRINRYIMECKLIPLLQKERAGRELIDTLWNVNKLYYGLQLTGKGN